MPLPRKIGQRDPVRLRQRRKPGREAHQKRRRLTGTQGCEPESARWKLLPGGMDEPDRRDGNTRCRATVEGRAGIGRVLCGRSHYTP